MSRGAQAGDRMPPPRRSAEPSVRRDLKSGERDIPGTLARMQIGEEQHGGREEAELATDQTPARAVIVVNRLLIMEFGRIVEVATIGPRGAVAAPRVADGQELVPLARRHIVLPDREGRESDGARSRDPLPVVHEPTAPRHPIPPPPPPSTP